MTSAYPDDGPPLGVSRVLDRTFKIGLVLKAADGVPELLAGALLLWLSPSTIDRIAQAVTAHELGQDPTTDSPTTSFTQRAT